MIKTELQSDFDVNQTIISQYANSPIILGLIKRARLMIDTMNNLSDFYDMIWNLDTASGFGLDFWGKVVGVERGVPINKSNYFSSSSLSFDDISKNQDISTYTYRMDDDLYRTIITVKAMSNLMYVSAKNINIMLNTLFENRGRAYFVKSGTMKARYVFEFNLTNIEKAIIISSGIFPRPSGVLIDFYEPDIDSTFGFTEGELAPFNVGAFYIGDQ